jgi:hypothetical protein
MILLTHLLLFHQYVNELLAGYSHSSYFGTARSYSKNNIQQRDNQSTGYNQPLPMSIISFISQSQNHLVRWLYSSCGEYRSRTDDLLLAKQAL